MSTHRSFLSNGFSILVRGFKMYNKMSVMPFRFTVAVDYKPWARAREVYRAIEYGKTTKTAGIVKHLGAMCCFLIFDYNLQRRRSRIQAIIEIQGDYQLAIIDRDNQIQTIEHDNMGLRGEIRAIDQQIERCEDTFTRLRIKVKTTSS